MSGSSNSEKYRKLLQLYSAAHASKSKAAVQNEVNELWTTLKNNAAEYETKVVELQDKKNVQTSRSLLFWAQLPKGMKSLFYSTTVHKLLNNKGSSIYDVHKKAGFLTQLPVD